MGRGRGSENAVRWRGRAALSWPTPQGHRVPRSADYTGGKIVVRERKGGTLGVPSDRALPALAETGVFDAMLETLAEMGGARHQRRHDRQQGGPGAS